MLVIDVSGLVYQCSWGNMKAVRGGEPDYASIAFRALLRIAERSEALCLPVVIAFDGGSQTRKEIFSDYKKNRKDNEMRTTVRGSLKALEEICSFLPYKYVRVIGLEADDIIAYLCEYFSLQQHFYRIVILSRDKDLWQLTRFRGVRIEDFAGNEMELDLSPHQHVAYKCLVGDSSDAIPGVLGIGDKSARALLSEFGTLANIMSYGRAQGKLGRMSYEEVLEIIRRNLKLMLLTQYITNKKMINSIDSQFNRTQELDEEGLKAYVDLHKVDSKFSDSLIFIIKRSNRQCLLKI
jgi:DNA polymerase-1